MIRLNDSIGLSAFRTAATAPEPATSGDTRCACGTLEADFLNVAGSIGSEVDATVRGSSVSQHAANVLWHLCGDAG
jgi:hypothetical protein